MSNPSAVQGPLELRLALDTTEELFQPGCPGRDIGLAGDSMLWDRVGAILGESGTSRLMRMLYIHKSASSIVLVVRRFHPGDSTSETSDAALDSVSLTRRLHAWCRAQIEANQQLCRSMMRVGLRALLFAMLALGLVLAVAWLLAEDVVFGPPGPLRTLASEALIIAGWVAMWRPIEMLVFDPMKPRLETRLLRRALALPLRIEQSEHSQSR